MSRYILRFFDRAGSVWQNLPVEARDVHAALAIANHRLRSPVADAVNARSLDRIDVADGQGRTVARLICSEALAALS